MLQRQHVPPSTTAFASISTVRFLRRNHNPMATATAGSLSLAPILVLLLLLSAPSPSNSFFYSQYQTLFSLAHSLMMRVANLRAERGDAAGSARAARLAEKLERGRGLGFWGNTWSLGWDYVKNYAWRDLGSADIFGAVSDVNEILKRVNELTRLESDSERKDWIVRNYQAVYRVSKSLFRRLLLVFRRSGPLREVVETLQREVDGGLLKDCLELGTNDLKGLIQVFKDLVLQFSSSSSGGHADL